MSEKRMFCVEAGEEFDIRILGARTVSDPEGLISDGVTFEFKARNDGSSLVRVASYTKAAQTENS
jgi:hypothetical protein